MDGKTVQANLFKQKADPMEGFERPSFIESDFPFAKKANKKPMADENWFYVDFYGKDELFNRLTSLLKKHKAISGKHKVLPEYFVEILEAANK